MAEEPCEYHTQLVADIAVIKNDLNYIKTEVCSHIKQGEEKGGFRDRLILLELAVSELKKWEWGRLIVASLVGGLIGSGSSDIIRIFIQWLMKR